MPLVSLGTHISPQTPHVNINYPYGSIDERQLRHVSAFSVLWLCMELGAASIISPPIVEKKEFTQLPTGTTGIKTMRSQLASM